MADAVRTSLGPRGMDKMVRSNMMTYDDLIYLMMTFVKYDLYLMMTC